MRARGFSISLAVCLLATPHEARAQCSTIADPGQRTACLQSLVDLRKELGNYVKGTDLQNKNYVTNSELQDKKYVTDVELQNKKYVTDTELGNRKYVTAEDLKKGLDPYAKSTTGDYFWILLAVVLVLIMQAGFLLLEGGLIRRQFDRLLAAYKLSALFMTYAGYLPIGFGLMFGTSSLWGFWGTLGFPASIISVANEAMKGVTPGSDDVRSIGFFLFQAAFAATAVTIPSGAIAERMSVKGFTFASFCMAFLIYPVFGHWAWGGGIYTEDILAALVKSSNPDAVMAKISGVTSMGWLQRNGFHDFAGSTVVHSVGGWFALVGALTLGPRPGRFGENPRSFPSTSMVMATAGALFLFFGWFGFNGGSKLAYSTKVDDVVSATVVAGLVAGLTATAGALLGEWRQWKGTGYVMEKALGGFLGGLVAITASCDLTSQLWQPVAIGATAGIVHNLVFDLLIRFQIDDPVGAIPVHLGCGVWGTACVAVLNGQFVAQAVGIAAAFFWAFGTASLVFGLLSISKKLNIGDWLFLSEFEKRHLVRPVRED